MKRILHQVWMIVALAVLVGAAASRIVPAVDIRGAGGAARPPLQVIGVAGCAAAACHGGTRPGERSEYMTWIQRDRHAQAYSVLFNERSQRIARNLSITQPETDKRCLACHSTAPELPHGEQFSKEDGVSCETCHGPAGRWLVPHTRPDWKQKTAAEKYGPFGMTNTKDLAVRAAVCVRCHIGAPGQEVTHELIAAGHPALLFELDAYTANMPPHWPENSKSQPANGARAWAIGQAVALRQSLELLQSQATSDRWPEFSQFECYACHHQLREKSWRQAVGYGARPPGGPVWSDPQWLIVQRLAASTGKKQNATPEFDSLRVLLVRSNSSASDVAAAAGKAVATATQIIEQVKQQQWDGPRLRKLLSDLAEELDATNLDYATALHITMALGTVLEAAVSADTGGGEAASIWSQKAKPHLDRLYDGLQVPADFDATKFVQDLKSFRNVVQE